MLVLCSSALFAGCSSSSASYPTHETPANQTVTPVGAGISSPDDTVLSGTTSAETAPTPTDGQTYIGTYQDTLQGGGNYLISYSIGTPTTDDTAPDIQAATEACSDVVDFAQGRTVFIPYTLTLHYNGNLPITVKWGNDPGAATDDDAMNQDFSKAVSLQMPISYNGQWTCYENQYEIDGFPAGGNATFHAVFIANDFLTNNQPTFDPAQHTGWHLDGSEILILDRAQQASVTGPHKCANDTALSLFGTAGTQC